VDTWEWVERGGDYLAPLALVVLLRLGARAGDATGGLVEAMADLRQALRFTG